MNKQLVNYTDVLERFKTAKNLRNDAELARHLGVSTAVISNWKARNTVNHDLLIEKAGDTSLSWLFLNIGLPKVVDSKWQVTLEDKVEVLGMQKDLMQILLEKAERLLHVAPQAPEAQKIRDEMQTIRKVSELLDKLTGES